MKSEVIIVHGRYSLVARRPALVPALSHLVDTGRLTGFPEIFLSLTLRWAGKPSPLRIGTNS
jgi:hypothetical protein